MYKRMFAAICLVAGLGAAQVHAQNLEMVEPPAAIPVSSPSRGLSMAQVERRFGEPSQRVAAVGEPPISRWVYPQFVVYFEGSYVIHAVERRGTPTS
jgi:hypothetical protein